MSRLVIDIPDSQHQKIKALAILRGKTIKQLILEKILTEIDDGRDHTMHQNLEAVFALRILGKKSRYSRKKMCQIMETVIENRKEEDRIYESIIRNHQNRRR
ncbi:MAG: antitoxin [Alphaproteobacteria bacterium]|nr:antitoxin [Alphaproteobacteria bacterium]